MFEVLVLKSLFFYRFYILTTRSLNFQVIALEKSQSVFEKSFTEKEFQLNTSLQELDEARTQLLSQETMVKYSCIGNLCPSPLLDFP